MVCLDIPNLVILGVVCSSVAVIFESLSFALHPLSEMKIPKDVQLCFLRIFIWSPLCFTDGLGATAYKQQYF